MASLPIWIRDDTGVRSLEPTLPNCWHGEADCVVGPFSSKMVAEYFALSSVERKAFASATDSVFANGDAWYVEIKALNA